jgi:hypothetical protein
MEMTRENAWGELRLFCKEIEKVTSSERSALQPLVNTDWRVVEGSMNLQPSLAGLISTAVARPSLRGVPGYFH